MRHARRSSARSLARETLQNKYYGPESAIEKEVSIWSAFFGDTSASANDGSTSYAAQADDDWGIDALANSFAQLGNSLCVFGLGGASVLGTKHASRITHHALTVGIRSFSSARIDGLDQVADAVGNLGDLIPELIFGEEYYEDDEEYYEEGGRRNRKDGEVVVGGKRQLKKRGGGTKAEGTHALASAEDLSDDERGEDWTKED